MASIELKNVTKIYEGFKALDALNLTVPSGSVYGLIGPNGAGKTTAIRHIMGVLRQDAGSVLLDGEPVFENPAVKARMLCIPDEPYFTSTSTTRDLMKFTRALYPRFDTERYEKLREIFALDDTRPIRRLSRGMQKQSPCRTARRCRRRDWTFSTAPRPASCRRSYCAAGKRTISRGSKSCTRCSWIPCR